MDPSQKQAVTIMLQSLQAQIMGIMGVLNINSVPQSTAAPSNQAAPAYLSEDEETRVEQALEKVRSEVDNSERESGSIQERWAKQRAEMEDALGAIT